MKRETASAAAGQSIRVPITADRGTFLADLRSLGRVQPFRIPITLILPAAAALAPLLGALAVLPAAAAAAGFGIGALTIGMSGLIDTVKSYTQAQDSLIGRSASLRASQLSTASAITSANQAVRASIRAVTDAQNESARRITTAEQALTDSGTAYARAKRDAATELAAADRNVEAASRSLAAAERSALRAREDLTRATEDQTHALEDLDFQVRDSAQSLEEAQRAQERAALDLAEAHAAGNRELLVSNEALLASSRNLQDVLDRPYSGQEVRDAALAYERAELNVERATRALGRSKAEQDAAARSGVTGSRAVSDAAARVEDADRAVAEGKRALGEAAREAGEVEVAALERVADARERTGAAAAELDRERAAGLRSVEAAQEGAADAARALALAQAQAASAAESQAGSLSEFNARLAQLAPNAQGAVLETLALGGAWRELRLDTQQALFAGVGVAIRELGATALPVLHTGFVGVAGAINEAVVRAAEFATSQEAARDWAGILDNTALAGDNLADSVGPILQIITDIVAVGAELLPGLAEGFTDGAESAAEFVREARESGRLKEWIQQGLDTVGVLLDTMRDLVTVFLEVSEVVGPPLVGFFREFADVVSWINDKVPGAIPILTGMALAIGGVTVATRLLNAAFLANPIGLVIIAIAGLISWFVYMWTTSEDFRDFWIGLWDTIVGAVKGATNGVVEAINGIIWGINQLIIGWNQIPWVPDIPEIPSISWRWHAAGGPAGGLSWVGERGPELVNLPHGSMVHTAPSSAVMAAGSGGGRPGGMSVDINLSGLPDDILELIRAGITARGGDVQVVLGSGRSTMGTIA